ncbi:MAG: hypothetical protein JSU66_02140 [Deltaproteobacteria bacterium]|nr:MAG: hypothetical protein JSU66_02140 [Deltaproteobacteria bacterium]
MIHRRAFLSGSLAVFTWPLAARVARAQAGAEPAGTGALPPATLRALEASPYVYVSPLLAGGRESTCHGEVWYGWIDGAVVLTTGTTTWKARSIARGHDEARIWVGDYGRWKTLTGRSEDFRAGPSFVARARIVEDSALLDRLLRIFDKKYPDEIGRWRDRMRRGHASGERVLIRYRPHVG